jgi:hypothetical protein
LALALANMEDSIKSSMLELAFEDYSLKAKSLIRKSERDSIFHCSSFTFRSTSYKGKDHSTCLDRGTQSITKAYTDTEFPLCHENNSINITLQSICRKFLPSKHLNRRRIRIKNIVAQLKSRVTSEASLQEAIEFTCLLSQMLSLRDRQILQSIATKRGCLVSTILDIMNKVIIEEKLPL